jgi:hypothetical protein
LWLNRHLVIMTLRFCKIGSQQVHILASSILGFCWSKYKIRWHCARITVRLVLRLLQYLEFDVLIFRFAQPVLFFDRLLIPRPNLAPIPELVRDFRGYLGVRRNYANFYFLINFIALIMKSLAKILLTWQFWWASSPSWSLKLYLQSEHSNLVWSLESKCGFFCALFYEVSLQLSPPSSSLLQSSPL